MEEAIMSTKNYDLFHPHPMNRQVRPETKRFKTLVESMEKHGHISAYPLHCVKNGNGKLLVKAGHNRLEAAKQLGIPVKYVVLNDDAHIHELEDGGPGRWNNENYLESFAGMGIESYCEVAEYMERTGIGFVNAISMFHGNHAGASNFSKDGKFKSGKFEIKEREHPRIVGDIVLHLKSVGIEWAANSSIVNAISKVVAIPEFDVERFKYKAETHREYVEKQKSIAAYLQLIELIYNFKANKKSRLNVAFRAQEVADQNNFAK